MFSHLPSFEPILVEVEHSLKECLSTVVCHCAGDSIYAIVLKWTEDVLKWTVIVLNWIASEGLATVCSEVTLKLCVGGWYQSGIKWPPVTVADLWLNWSELLLYWREVLLCWSGPSKVEVLFVVKWHWSCVWVVGTKWYQVEHLRFSCYFMLILKWSVCTEVNLNLSWSWQLVSWDIRWATSCIWGLPRPNWWIEVLVCGVKILWLTHKSWQSWRSQILNLVLKVP